MKKFISMVMAAAMVVSLVPATAFAASLSMKVDNVADWTEQEADAEEKAGRDLVIDGVQLQLKLTDVDGTYNKFDDEYEIKLKFDGAEFKADKATDDAFSVELYSKDDNTFIPARDMTYSWDYEKEDEKVTITVKENAKTEDFADGDTLYINFLNATEPLIMQSTKVGAQATVAVSGDLGSADAKVIAEVVEAGIAVDIDDTVDVAEEEIAKLEKDGLTIEAKGADTFKGVLDWKYDSDGDNGTTHAKVVLKLNKGFEFANVDRMTIEATEPGAATRVLGTGAYEVDDSEDDEITLYVVTGFDKFEEIIIKGLEVEAVDAKVGDVATIKVSTPGVDAQTIEVAVVVAEGLTISVDEDEDVPVMWSGVNAKNFGLTADEDEHEALEVTIEESFVGSYSDKDEIELVLPEGVWVTNVKFGDVKGTATLDKTEAEKQFKAAYQEGDHTSFIFEKRAFDETEPGNDEIKIEFTMELVADPTFAGDVELEMLIDGESAGKVLIAKFEAPMVIEASQNDLKIDYRNTEVPTDIVIKEAEANLWKKGEFELGLGLDRYISFEDDLVYTVNEDESDMEIDGDDKTLFFDLDKESDEEAAVITVSNISLYMDRNLAAGAYDLEIVDCEPIAQYEAQLLYAPDETGCTANGTYDKDGNIVGHNDTKECYVADVCDYSSVVKEGWINIVTAGREQDDASFTTKVVVTIGAMELTAGETVIALDVPAYINAEGYTMLPIRAVATALGINNDAVIWSQAAKQVTILYGQRVITMTVGSNVMYVNGSAIPTSAAVEIVNGRTFLPLRDLATALGVTDITWDQATKTATLNGGK